MKNIFLIIALVFVFSGCTATEFQDGAKGVGDDVSKLFDVKK